MNQKFTEKVQAWLAQDAEQRDYAQGALLLLQLTGNQIMYRNLMVNPKRRAEFIEYQLKKRLSFRLNQVTHEQVEAMQAEVDKIVVNRNLEVKQQQPANEFKAGKRADHDQLPDEIQALYVDNLGIVQKMRELHLKLRSPTVSATRSSRNSSPLINGCTPTGSSTTTTPAWTASSDSPPMSARRARRPSV